MPELMVVPSQFEMPAQPFRASGQRFRNLLCVLLKGGAVGYVGFRDQIGGRRFGLLRVNRHDAHGTGSKCLPAGPVLGCLSYSLCVLLLWVCPDTHNKLRPALQYSVRIWILLP